MATDVVTALRREAVKDRQSAMAWIAAGGLVAGFSAVVGSASVAFFAALFGVWFALYDLRMEVGVRLAAKDIARGDTAPRRAYVVLLRDPNPRAHRPLLAVWRNPPVAGERLPRADLVMRCDDDLDDLESSARAVVVHEAWVDTGPRRTSKPRWVVADAGVVVPHRRSYLTKWYLRSLTRHSEVPGPVPLTVDPPMPGPTTGPVPAVERRWVTSIAWRCLGVGFFASLILLRD